MAGGPVCRRAQRATYASVAYAGVTSRGGLPAAPPAHLAPPEGPPRDPARRPVGHRPSPVDPSDRPAPHPEGTRVADASYDPRVAHLDPAALRGFTPTWC